MDLLRKAEYIRGNHQFFNILGRKGPRSKQNIARDEYSKLRGINPKKINKNKEGDRSDEEEKNQTDVDAVHHDFILVS